MIKEKEVYRMEKKRVWILVLLLLLAVGAVLTSVLLLSRGGEGAYRNARLVQGPSTGQPLSVEAYLHMEERLVR